MMHSATWETAEQRGRGAGGSGAIWSEGYPLSWRMATIGYAPATTRRKTPTFHSNWLTRPGNYRNSTACRRKEERCRSFSFR